MHLHITFTFTHLLVYSRHSTFVMHHLLQRGWYHTIMHPPSTICCPILGLIRLFSWDIPTPRVFSLDIPTRALGIYEDITHALGIYEDNTLINPDMGHAINTGTHMCIFVRIAV